MKTLAILTGMLMFMVGTCKEHDQMGLPKKVVFSKEGGTQVVRGNQDFDSVIFSPSNNGATTEYVYLDADSSRVMQVITKNWLTIRYEWQTSEITFEAQPSEASKKRKFDIRCSNFEKYAYINVEQQ